MADLKRWFKVWTTLLVDMDDVSDELVGKWTRLGCRIASVGSKGTVVFASKAHAARFFRVETEQLLNCLQAIPGCSFSISYEGNGEPPFIISEEATERSFSVPAQEGKTVYGQVAVTMRNWHRYQVDHTAAERMQTLRSKKRRDEKRDKASETGLSVTAPPPHHIPKSTYKAKPKLEPQPPTPVTHLPHYPEPEPDAHKHAMASLKEILDKAKPIPPPTPRASYVPKGEPHYQPDKQPTDPPTTTPDPKPDDPWAEA